MSLHERRQVVNPDLCIVLFCTKEACQYANLQNQWMYPLARGRILSRARAKISTSG